MNNEPAVMRRATTTPVAEHTHAILYRRALRAYTGTALGLSQPVILLELSVSSHCPTDFSLIDEYLERLTGEPVLAALAAETGHAALLRRIHQGYAGLLRSVNIPIFDDCFLGQRRPNSETGMLDCRLALPSTKPQLSVRVVQWLVSTINVLLTSPPDKEARLHTSNRVLDQLKALLRQNSLQNTNMIHFLRAAHQLHMPATDLGGGVFALGTGKNSRWFNSTITEVTSNMGCAIAKNKQVSANLLRRFCLPVPDHALASDEESAVKIARMLGYPVVVKPLDQEQGRGVFAGLRSEQNLRWAYQAAREFSKMILVERHHDGEDYRLTVMHDKLIKVMHRQPASVTGDGLSSVLQLIEALQSSSEQQKALRRTGKPRVALDEEALGLLTEQGLTPSDVPAANRRILLRRKGNISAGGSHHLVGLDNVHPDNAALAVRTAKILGLDFAGIDLIIADIAEPWHKSGAIICEVNAQPQIGYRDMPELYDRILREMIADGGRIALYLLPIDGQAAPTDQHLQKLADQLGCNALSTPNGVWRDGKQLAWSPPNSFAAARALLLDKEAMAGLMVMTHTDIMRHGLPAADFKVVGIGGNDPGDSGPIASGVANKARALVDSHQQARTRRWRSQQGAS